MAIAALVCSSASPERAIAGKRMGDICAAAAQDAARAHGIPADILLALTLTETATRRDGRVQPWPWAVNDGGSGHWFDTKDAAVKYAFDRFKAGARNFDVGCFQLNFRWHGSSFDSLADMFDPARNADYAARFLLTHFQETNDWELAAGRYHSLNETYAARYRAAFADHHDRVTSDGAQLDAPVLPPRRDVGLAGLAAGAGPASAGSLVSLAVQPSPMFAAAQRLWP